jgi:hypothetical protein
MRAVASVIRRFASLLVLAVVALGVVGVSYSFASFTTTSTSDISATGAHVHDWLHLYSQSTDPAGLTGYATQRVRTGVGPLCATGFDETLALTMGGIRSRNTTYSFARVFTIQTPATFPDGSITRVTVTATYDPDPSTGLQPIRDVRFAAVGNNNGRASVNLNRNVKDQANVRLRARGGGWTLNGTYYPTVHITVTYTGSPASYYVYDIPLAVTIVNW